MNWGTGGADAPDWLLQLVVRKKQKSSTHPGKGKLQINAFNADAVGIIKAALAAIAAACACCGKWPYDTWFEVGCALYFELGEAGFELFDRWSATSPNYNHHSCVAKWRECGKIGTVGNYTIGTIYYYANQAVPGWHSAFLARSFGWGKQQ